MTSDAVNSNGDTDCADLFKGGGIGNGKEDAIWFLKDPAKDGFGMGVSVHTMNSLMQVHGIHSETAATDHKGLRQSCNKLSRKLRKENTKLLVQRGVDPLLLDGSRKFDLRLYVNVKAISWFSPRICSRTLIEGVRRPHQCSLGVAACYSYLC